MPVHPSLIKLGFNEFVERQRAGEHDHLFNATNPRAFGRWFARHLVACGAKTPKTTWHSTRHNFRDAIGATGAPRDVVLSAGGWASSHVADIYGSGPSPKALFEWVSKIKYPGIDLDHLGQGE